MMKTRICQPTDEDAIVALARQFIEEQHPCTEFSEHATREAFWKCQADPALAVFVLESGSKVVGFMLATAMQMVFTKSVCVMQSILHVDRKHRTDAAEQMLLSEFDAWAKSVGAVETIFAAPAGAGGLAASRFANSEGYFPVGALMGRARGAAYVS